MRAILISAAAATAVLAGCTMDTANQPVVVTETDAVVATTPSGEPVVVAATTPVAVVTPATDPIVVPPGQAAPLPMIGQWRCASTGFTITPGNYTTAGGSATRIESIERLGVTDYRLTLSDAKKIRLTNIIDGKLTWQHENNNSGSQTATCTKQM